MRFSNRKRRGAIVVLVALCLIPLLAILALVLDGGVLRHDRRRIQTAADMAALAAATDLFAHYATMQGMDLNGTASQSALAIASGNGFNNDGKTNTVNVNVSPSTYQGGEWKGQVIPPGYVEVIISYQQPSSFSAIWGVQNTQVSARSVARGTWQPASPSIHVLREYPVHSGRHGSDQRPCAHQFERSGRPQHFRRWFDVCPRILLLRRRRR
jgi:uncharacterized membrane protein